MRISISIAAVAALLALAALGCQTSAGSENLRKEVTASSEFAAFAEAYENRGADLMKEMQEESQRLKQELDSLDTRGKRLRREQAEQQRLEKQKQEEALNQKLSQRNARISTLLSGEEKLSKEALNEAIRRVDDSLGITPEMLVPARTQNMEAALDALMEKFPEIRDQEASFLQDCLEAYRKE